MTPTGTGTVISVWFACKICRQSFQHIDNFLEHKQEVHFDEFQKLSCIVFEERAIANIVDYNLDDGLSLPPAAVAVIKQEQILSSDDQHLDLKPVINFGQAIKTEAELTIFQIKSEVIKFPKNPYVLLRRLTSKEIQRYNKFQTQAFLPQHFKVPSESEERPLKCPRTNCRKAFQTYSCLIQHEKSHTQERKFKFLSVYCGKSLKTRKSVLSNLKTHTDNKQFKCQESHCRKICSTRKNIMSHMETHYHEKRFKCPRPNCEKAYSARRTLRAHLETHSEDKNFKCQEPNCGKAFKRKEHLRGHLKIHSDSRPCFHCPYPSCEKVFRKKHGLKLHCVSRHSQDSASEEKLLKYKKCDRTGCLSDRYQRSLDRGPIKCPQPNCTKEFKHESTLRNHLVRHSNVKSYECSVPQCEKAFKTPYEVKQHVQKTHKL